MAIFSSVSLISYFEFFLATSDVLNASDTTPRKNHLGNCSILICTMGLETITVTIMA